MAGKKEYAVVSTITNLTKGEASALKQVLVEYTKNNIPKANYFASTGNGTNVARAVSKYEAKRITSGS